MMQTVREIKSYLSRTYTKADLVDLLAKWYLNDTLPPDLPHDLGPVYRQSRPGRPTHTDDIELGRAMNEYLTALGERRISRAVLLKTFGMTEPRLDRLIHQPAFLKLLTQDNRTRLTTIWYRKQGRLSAIQRAVLDLHNYALVLAYGRNYRLRLYDMHRLIWTSVVDLDTSPKHAQNGMELKRVYQKVVPVLTPLGYPSLTPIDHPEGTQLLTEGPCAVLQAILNDENLANVEYARFVLETQRPHMALGQSSVDYIGADWSWEDALRAIAGRVE